MAGENARQGMLYAIGATVCAGIILAGGGLVLTSFQGHASDSELRAAKVETARVEKESKERDAKTEVKLEKHLVQYQKEAIKQAAFRAAMIVKLSLELPLED